MTKKEDKDTRYFIDLDLRTRKVLAWDYGNRHHLALQDPEQPFHHRVFLSKGQFNKLVKKNLDL